MADLGFSESQLSYAERIIGVGKGRGASKKDIQTALMVALDESQIQNLANNSVPESQGIAHDGVGGDHDSVGIFQQRPSQGWGTPQELMNPDVAAGKFYDALDKLPSKIGPAWVNAQLVQRSFDPTGANYHAHADNAQKIMDALYDGATISRDSPVKKSVADNPLVSAGKIVGWISDQKNWTRIAQFAFGGILLLFVIILMVKNSKTGQAVTKVAVKAAAL